MKNFLDKDFLLETDVARDLYHHHAAPQPIIDYHCHLVPAMVAEDHRFRSITELWLGGDHYKWRAMRTNGVLKPLKAGEDDPQHDWETLPDEFAPDVDDPTGIRPLIRTVEADGTHRYYDLSGRRLPGKPQRGVYIDNGVKKISNAK